MILPFSTELQEASTNFSEGNFGLWFNKLIPVDERESFKACDSRGDTKNVVGFYISQYDKARRSPLLKSLLEKRHKTQQALCARHEAAGFAALEIKAKLASPLITGIGKTHPNEVGMIFDHTLGIPYLPASGIKGLVRLGHILNLINDPEKADLLISGDELDDEHPASQIPELFGGDWKSENKSEKFRGRVIFLDAYPEKVPELKVDIMNPHYGAYYGDEQDKQPPGDYLNPVPIKFLTVPEGETFIFRAVLTKDKRLNAAVFDAFSVALTEQGLGAKTAVGYGRFSMEKQPRRDAASPEASDLSGEQSKFKTPVHETWVQVYLTYSPGNQEVTAVAQSRKATHIGKEIIPEPIAKKFFKNKSATVSKVDVEPVGKNYRIVSITI
ncbi:type III-B CRISPR module RAMP protein Cmr6 [Desulfococcus sp.]|uniref:type III-B CRISPR module RAMP protein Cmr6 n=1 Tax=Desulfococcus sp. TaxID=2025834 RepID=UPI003593B60A